MTLIGLDFDNTLVRYDDLFHKLATEKKLIDNKTPADKVEIRNYLREQGQDEEFTLLQGEVYGGRILEADPAEGMLDALKKLKEQEKKMVIISHKTRYPYRGPAYDLRDMAMKWLEKYQVKDILDNKKTRMSIYFADSKEEKIRMIEKLGCDYYIDDLIEILQAIPKRIFKIHYNPTMNEVESKKDNNLSIKTMRAWKDLDGIINQ